MTVKGKTVLVTGASRGFGRAAALAFLRAGARVLGVGRDPKAIAETRALLEEVGGEFEIGKLDVTDEGAVKEYIGALDRLDVLVNNAGIARAKPTLDTAADELREVLEINVVAAFVVMREGARKMLGHGGGHIINIASDAALHGIAAMAPYAASKHALLGLSRSLSAEFRKQGVRVTAFCPGPITTDIFGPGTAMAGALPPDELAEMLVHLASQPISIETQEVRVEPTWLRGLASAENG